MKNIFVIKKKINSFKKKIFIEGDKSISIRWVLLSSLSKKKSRAYNLLNSEDVISALNCVKKLGANVKIRKDYCEIIGTGLNYIEKKNLVLNAGNSGTLSRLILGLLVNYKKTVKIIGDKSLSKRDFSRVTVPLKKFGLDIISKNQGLPLMIRGLERPKPIFYKEKRGSAQCKSSVMLAALKANGTTNIQAKKSRNHTELFFKYLKIPIRLKTTKNLDYIKVSSAKKINPVNYKIPGDISSSSFLIVLTLLTKNSELLIKNVNINSSRIGIIHILKKMGAHIVFRNVKNYKGEKVGDIFVKSSSQLKGLNCPIKYNSSAIDEFLIIFLVAAKSKGISYFKNLSELNQKESPRLIWGSKILNLMGIKTDMTESSLKIYGNPNLKLNKKIIIKNYLKDHRVFMMSTIAGLTCGGNWVISDLDSIKTSFPSFLKTIKTISR